LFRAKFAKLKKSSCPSALICLCISLRCKIVDFPTASITPFLFSLQLFLLMFALNSVLALFPRNVRAVIEELATLANTPMLTNVAQPDDTFKPSVVVIINLAAVNDLNATLLLNQQKQAPALVGACNQCFITGISSKGYEIKGEDNTKGSSYFRALRDSPVNHPLREEFANVPDVPNCMGRLLRLRNCGVARMHSSFGKSRSRSELSASISTTSVC
jgi:hypothetical protein